MNYEHFFNEENDDSDESASNRLRPRNLRERPKPRRVDGLGGKFIEDFDPEQSTRERRKLTRRSYMQSSSKSANMFDEKGRYRHNNANVCDCLDSGCPGCQFPCPMCRSPKCGTTCRVNRKWAFEVIEHDGKDLFVKNRNLSMK